ncbi:MAG: TIGR01777 family oxidoreductase [Proteobacteria bacterium]|nr:TIGR01777 family oxidoreductase [Pseudomonadota bacterium]
MRIAIAGSSGFIGSELIKKLTLDGHEIIKLKRSLVGLKGNDVYFNYKEKVVSRERLENLDALINLAGDNIANGRWTKQKKEEIYDSRIESCKFLTSTIKQLKNPPPVILSASAIGYYGNRGQELLNEVSEKGKGFLAKVCEDWEESINPLSEISRVVNLRFGLVLSKEGGPLKKMLLPFKLGLGGRLGSGSQLMSWISCRDLISGILFCLENKNILGPVNFVTTEAISNSDFTKALATSLKRPAFFHVPSFILKLLLGEMAEELLLSSTKVEPKKLTNSGFKFQDTDLTSYLAEI